MTKEEEDMIAEMSGEEFDEYQKSGKKPARFEKASAEPVTPGSTGPEPTPEKGGPFARRNEELKKLKKHFGD